MKGKVNKMANKEKVEVTVVSPKKETKALILPTAQEQFKNPELAKHMATIRSAEGKGIEQAWTIARNYVEIIESNCFVDDFGDQKTFCAYIGKSPAIISRYKKAMHFRRKYLAEVKANKYTVHRAALLDRLGDDKDDFFDWLKKKKKKVTSDHALEELIDDYHEKDVIDVTPEDEDDEEDEIIETAEEKAITPKTLTKAGGDKYVTFDYDGKTYEIPLKALAKYEKKAEKQEEQEG